MKNDIKTEVVENYIDDSVHVRSIFPRQVLAEAFPYAIFQEVVRQVAEVVAKQILEDKLPEILEKVTPQAIANMAIAEAGAALNETLHKKMPDKILEIEKNSTEIYQRGVFGGMKRIK